MSLTTNIEKLSLLVKEIKAGNTGNSKKLAIKLDISRSMIFVYLKELQLMGAKIDYSRKLKSFIFLNNFEINVKVAFKNQRRKKKK